MCGCPNYSKLLDYLNDSVYLALLYDTKDLLIILPLWFIGQTAYLYFMGYKGDNDNSKVLNTAILN